MELGKRFVDFVSLPARVFRGDSHSVEEFAMVFYFLFQRTSVEDFLVRFQLACRIVHNGTLFCDLLWRPLYLLTLTVQELSVCMTLRDGKKQIEILADGTDHPCEHSGDLCVSACTYSQKGKASALRTEVICLGNRFILELLPDFGAHMSEGHLLRRSCQLGLLRRDPDVSVRLWVDRGNSAIELSAGGGEDLLLEIPPFLGSQWGRAVLP